MKFKVGDILKHQTGYFRIIITGYYEDEYTQQSTYTCNIYNGETPHIEERVCYNHIHYVEEDYVLDEKSMRNRKLKKLLDEV